MKGNVTQNWLTVFCVIAEKHILVAFGTALFAAHGCLVTVFKIHTTIDYAWAAFKCTILKNVTSNTLMYSSRRCSLLNL